MQWCLGSLTILGALATKVSPLASPRLSVRPRVTTGERMNGFWLNFIQYSEVLSNLSIHSSFG
jgi:nitrous oxidase accessory protein NosD